MTTNPPLKSRISELSAMERRLWTAFKDAEKEYIPPAFNPWKVGVTFHRLWRQKFLRFHECYPLYGLFAIACAMAAIFGRPLFFLGYLGFLAVSGFYINKYVEQFAFQKTRIQGLERSSFGVSHLALLVHGMTRLLEEGKAGAAVPTRDALASIIKLVKVGHEHGEIGYGFGDAAKKWFYGAVIGAASAAYAHAAEVSGIAAKVWRVIAGNWTASVAVAVLIFGAAIAFYGLFFSAANEKRRKRRYLLALNTIHETWPS